MRRLVQQATTGAADLQEGTSPLCFDLLRGLGDGTDASLFDALLIAKGSGLILEWYEKPTLRQRRIAAGDLTQLLGTALAAIGIERGELAGLDADVRVLFPELDAVTPPIPETLRLCDLLTRTSRGYWTEGAAHSHLLYNSNRHMLRRERDPLAYVLGRSRRDSASATAHSGLALYLALAISRGARQPFGQLAERRVLKPLGIDDYRWSGPEAWAAVAELTWRGSVIDPAAGLQLRARDLLKLGSLFAQGGTWQGQQVLPRDFVTAALRRRAARQRKTFELKSSPPRDSLRHSAAGFGFWIDRYDLPSGSHEVFSAECYMGHRLWIIPAHGITVLAMIRDPHPEFSSPIDAADGLLLDHVLPWLDRAERAPDFLRSRVVEIHSPDSPAPAWPPSQELRSLCGTYRTRFPHQEGYVEIAVQLREGRLILRIDAVGAEAREEQQLVPHTHGLYLTGQYSNGRLTRTYPEGPFISFARVHLAETGEVSQRKWLNHNGLLLKPQSPPR